MKIPKRNQVDILGGVDVKINQDFIFMLEKNCTENIDPQYEKTCKIIKILGWNIHEIIINLSKYNFKRLSNLFIFIIEINNLELLQLNSNEISAKVDILLNFMLNLNANRSAIVQLQSSKEKLVKIYYKETDFNSWCDVKESTNSEDFDCFSSFLWFYLCNEREKFENLVLEKLSKVKNSTLVIKFLRVLNIPGKFHDNLALKCVELSESDLLASIDGFIDDDGNIQGDYLKYYLSKKLCSTSILHKAIQQKDSIIFKFLVKTCSVYIQQLPFNHQIKISTHAFESNQFENLCDLLQVADFPFPKDFNSALVTDSSLLEIIIARTKFHNITDENIDQIQIFHKNHPNLKFVYNCENKSAIHKSLELSKYKTFFCLRAFGFDDRKIKNIPDDILKQEEVKDKIDDFITLQRTENVKFSSSENQSVIKLIGRTFIFRRHRNTETVEEQWNKITKWYKMIYKTEFGKHIFDAAAQCMEIKIIFDFEYLSVSFYKRFHFSFFVSVIPL